MPQKQPLRKLWSKSRDLKVITPSRYEKNEASIKAYWKNVVKELELSYKDDKFWESNTKTVRSILPANTFKRLAKIYNLPLQDEPYAVKSEMSVVEPSIQYYKSRTPLRSSKSRMKYSMSDFEEPEDSKCAESPEMSAWSDDSDDSAAPSVKKSSRMILRGSVRSLTQTVVDDDYDSVSTGDDLIVHCGDVRPVTEKKKSKIKANPHYEMLRTNKSETDMIKWSSNYRTKQLEVSASDEFSSKAQIVTKKIAKDFFDWYTAMGEVEFKSEIKRPEDIEELFQVWFDEHASRGLVLDPKILPCVLQSIATACGVPEVRDYHVYIHDWRASCPSVLKRQVAFDIWAETTPKHTTAFDSCLPQRKKHIPPANNTKELWHGVRIPDDLKTMACVWDEIKHLSSTKEFHKWLTKRPHLPMPACLERLDEADGKKALFVMPSDFMLRGSETSVGDNDDLALPVSQFDLELKTVLSRLMNQ